MGVDAAAEDDRQLNPPPSSLLHVPGWRATGDTPSEAIVYLPGFNASELEGLSLRGVYCASTLVAAVAWRLAGTARLVVSLGACLRRRSALRVQLPANG